MAVEAPVTTALVAGVVSLITSGVVTELQVRLENRTLFQAERVAHELLMTPGWDLRSFDAIKRRLGGFEDDEIRKVLIRAGALQFEGKRGQERWGLLERNRHRLEGKPGEGEQTDTD